jgi:glycosyltransferase involved in cell wall biosynthesis
VFVPIGANIPEPASQSEIHIGQDRKVKTVAVFCLTEMPKREDELGDISHAVRHVSTLGLRLRVVFCGRGTPEAKDDIERAFSDIPVETSIEGLMDSRRIAEILAGSDAMLCVRGKVNPRRGSVIAGITCGLPIVGYGGEAEGTPLADAGLELVAHRDRNALGAALFRVLGDEDYSETLRCRSLHAQREYFSWDRIADALITALG